MMPEEGYLSGTITRVDKNSFQLTDFNDHTWTVDYQDANIPPVIILEEGEMVKLIGEVTAKDLFQAQEIRPWGGVRQMNTRGNRSGK